MTAPSDRIRLEIPARPEYVVLARLTVSGVAGRAGFSYDDVEDLKVVTTEVCRLLVGEGTDGSIGITYAFDGDALEIVGEVAATGAVEADQLALHMIAALSDSHDVDSQNGVRRVRVTKRRA